MCTATPRAAFTLEASTAAPAAARLWARRALCPVHAGLSEQVALLVVSEMVTHAVLHGTPPLVLAVECEVVALALELDHAGWSSGDPMVDLNGELRLMLVEKITRRFEVYADGAGVRMLCELPTGALPGRS